MSDRTPETEDTPPETAPIDASRRKLAGAALGATAVFTLASRPVWANQCSISGMMSGNLSRPQETCEGCAPIYWMHCQHLDSWAATGFSPDDVFNTVFGVTQYVDPQNNHPYTLIEALGLQGVGDCTPTRPPANCNARPDGNAVANLGCDPISPTLGFHAVAALLNAAHPSVNFGYTAGELIDLFQKNYLKNPAALKDSLAMLNERSCPLS
jgi:hypothetical protein